MPRHIFLAANREFPYAAARLQQPQWRGSPTMNERIPPASSNNRSVAGAVTAPSASSNPNRLPHCFGRHPAKSVVPAVLENQLDR